MSRRRATPFVLVLACFAVLSATEARAAAEGTERADGATQRGVSRPSATEPRTRHRLLLFLRQDVAWTSAEGPCTPASQSNGEVSCFRDNGTQYLGTPRTIDPTSFQGFTPATTRLIGGYERFFGDVVSLSGLLGVVVQGGGPTPVGRDAHAFLPLHLEIDAAAWPAGAPAVSGQVRPFLFLGAGVGEIDSSVTVTVTEDRSARPPPSQLDNPAKQTLQAYSKYGTGFIAAGLGLEARVAGPVGIRGRLLGDFSFPGQGGALGFDVGLGVDL